VLNEPNDTGVVVVPKETGATDVPKDVDPEEVVVPKEGAGAPNEN